MPALDVRRNPALLKLDLYAKGLRVHDSLFVEQAGGRPILRTRAGLGSGLELILPGGHFTNVPVAEEFARRSPYLIRSDGGRLLLEREGRLVCQPRLAPRPAWYDRKTASGKPMSRVGTLQGTYLGIYPAKVCEFWTEAPRVNCHFCSVGLNLGMDDAVDKTVADVLEVAVAAATESGVTYIDFNTGHDENESYLDTLEPLIRAVKERTGCLIGVQTPPHGDLERYRHLRRLGVNRVSFCFEVFDPARFTDVCPGKSRTYGLDRYLEAIAWTARMGREPIHGRGPGGIDLAREPWLVNGEIVAGLEPAASTIAAIDWITARGAIPTVCVFRPLIGTDYEDVAPPDTEELLPVFQHLYRACMDRGLPIGVAPNVNVSLVLLPEECSGLVPTRLRDLPRRARLRTLKALFGRQFYRNRARLLQRAIPAAQAAEA